MDLPIQLEGPMLRPVITLYGVPIWECGRDDLISSCSLKNKQEYLEPASDVFRNRLRPYVVIDAEPNRWGKGKTHLADWSGNAVCGSTWRTTPNRQVQNFRDHITCKKCMKIF